MYPTPAGANKGDGGGSSKSAQELVFARCS
jgi:hypothetical protein